MVECISSLRFANGQYIFAINFRRTPVTMNSDNLILEPPSVRPRRPPQLPPRAAPTFSSSSSRRLHRRPTLPPKPVDLSSRAQERRRSSKLNSSSSGRQNNNTPQRQPPLLAPRPSLPPRSTSDHSSLASAASRRDRRRSVGALVSRRHQYFAQLSQVINYIYQNVEVVKYRNGPCRNVRTTMRLSCARRGLLRRPRTRRSRPAASIASRPLRPTSTSI